MDERSRETLAKMILGALERGVPGSAALLRGSSAQGHADRYSDIDALWEVPDDRFHDAIAAVAGILSAVASVESLRSDPAFQRSDKRRLFYLRFEGVPLFWRLDLDVLARSVGRDDAYDRTNPEARGPVWSRTESALMNVVAAIKAHHRRDDRKAAELLRRGYERVGLERRHDRLGNQLLDLTGGIRELDPETVPLVERIILLITEAFPELDQGNSRHA